MSKRGLGLSIAVYNWRGLINTILLQIIVFAIVVGILFQLIPPIIAGAIDILEILDIDDFLATISQQLTENNGDLTLLSQYLQEKFDLVEKELENLQNFVDKVVFTLIMLLLIGAIYKIVIAFSDIAIASSINEFMSTNSSRPILWYIVKRFGQSWLFALVQFLFTILMDAVVFFSVIGIATVFAPMIGRWVIVPVVVVSWLMFALRFTVTAYWLPSMVVSKKSIGEALADNFVTLTKRFKVIYLKTILMTGLMVVSIVLLNNSVIGISSAGALCTVLLIFTLFFVYKCICLREYYVAHGMPYFCKKMNLETME